MNNYERLNLYPHNIETCKKVKDAFDDGEQVVSIIKATGTGKSYIGLNLALEHKDEKIVWIVPTLAIKEHIERTINDNPNLSMERDFPNLEIRTYSSLVDMTREEIEDISCDLLIADELHHLGAPVWGERVNTLVETHSDMRVFGMSAYSVRDRGTAYERDMVNPDTEELFSDTVVDRYDLYDAIIDGVLPMPFAKSILVENSKIIEDLREAQKLKRIQGTPMYYEIEKVIDSITKTIHKQEPIKNIVQQSVKEDGKYIYFCPVNSSYGNNDMDTIMREMMEYLSEKYPSKRIVFYKTTSEMGENGKYNRECFYNDVDLDGIDVSDTIRIMFAKNQYNEGVHAPNIDGVFLGRETGSDIVALEQIGRALSVRGETSKKMEEYNKYTLEELKKMANSRGMMITEDITKEYLIELLVAPTIIDLADNIGFLQELETNLKDRIRERKNNGEPLTSRQIKMLEVWSTLDVEQKDLYKALMNLREQVQAYTWDNWYELAVNYYNYYGHSEVPYYFETKNGYEYDETGVKLGSWCDNQRQDYRKGNLKEERKNKLELINFRLETEDLDEKWERKYQLALAYYNEHGDSEIPSEFKTINGKDPDENGAALGRWCVDQRKKNKKGKLSVRRRIKLEEIEFRFETNERTLSWDDCYHLLIEYYKENGDLEVPSSFKTINGIDEDEKGYALGLWCERQRQEYRKGILKEERKNKLELINFRLETEDLDEKWESGYQLAIAYYNKYGHSEIPQKFRTINGIDKDEKGYTLGLWCNTQRHRFEIGKLSDERKKKLEQIKFRFETKKRTMSWDDWYQLAIAYYNEYGHSEMPALFKTINGKDPDENGEALGGWLRKQRERTLSEEKRNKLELIGFRFTTEKENEENKKNLCSEYGIEYDKYKILKKMSYQELYAKIMYLLDNGYSLLEGDKLHEIFSISNENMVLKYMISKEELITNYYINKKGKGV